MKMKISLRSWIFKIWYNYISTVDKNADVLFMNFGFDDPKNKIKLEPEYEKDRYSIQLYHRLAERICLTNKSVVEIGCGRGGGLAYITKRFSPSSSLGIDLNERAANFANNHYKINGLSFRQGDAHNLPLENQSFDVLLNVESSHRYLDFNQFLSEVKRVLKPNGYFLFTDFRRKKNYTEMLEAIENSGLTKIKECKINHNVVEALKNDSQRRQHLVKKLTPKFLHKTALNFAGVKGSKTYHQIEAGDFKYFMYVLKNT